MGFFKDLFKRKKGGTFFGNLLRGVSSTVTGGLLGSGKDLAKWQAKEEQKEYEQALAEQQALIKQSEGYLQGQALSRDFEGQFEGALSNSPLAKDVQNAQVKSWLQRNWWIPALIGGTIVTLIVMLVRKRK